MGSARPAPFTDLSGPMVGNPESQAHEPGAGSATSY